MGIKSFVSCITYSYFFLVHRLSFHFMFFFKFIYFNSRLIILQYCIGFFAVKKLLSLNRSHLSTFAFISIALGDWPKKTLAWFMLTNVFLMLPYISFMVSCLFQKFEAVLSLLLCMAWTCVLTPLIQHHLLKRLFFFYCFNIFLPPLSKINWL